MNLSHYTQIACIKSIHTKVYDMTKKVEVANILYLTLSGYQHIEGGTWLFLCIWGSQEMNMYLITSGD